MIGLGRRDACRVAVGRSPTLDALYPTRQYYLEQYDAATAALRRQGFILKEDVAKLRSIARKVTSVG